MTIEETRMTARTIIAMTRKMIVSPNDLVRYRLHRMEEFAEWGSETLHEDYPYILMEETLDECAKNPVHPFLKQGGANEIRLG